MAGKAGAVRHGRAFVELFADDTRLVHGLRKAEDKVRKFGQSVSAMGQGMLRAGAVMAAPLIASGKAFADFETQMKMVSTMLSDHDKFMDAYSAGIRKLAQDYGESTATLSKGLYDLLSASIDPAKAMGVLEVAVKAAKGGMTDTGVAADGLTSVLNAFGMSADQASHVADVMFATVKRGKLTFPDLAANIGKVAPMARAAGMSMEDMMAVIATMTRQGINTEEASTKLINILKKAPEDSQNILALVKRYMGKSLGQIQEDFPEIRAASGIAALAGDIAGLTQDLELMQKAGGLAEEAFKKMTGGLGYEIKKVIETIKAAAVGVGEVLKPEVIAAAHAFKQMVVDAGEWIKQHQGVIITAAKVAATLIGIGASLIVIGKVAVGVAALIKVFRLAVTAAHALNTAMVLLASNPIALYIGAIVAVTGALFLGATAVSMALRETASAAAETSTAMRDLREKGDQLRQADRDQAAQLAALGGRYNLTNREMAAAKAIIKQLEDRYGPLGMVVNEATGSILNMAEAQERLNKAMQKQRVAQLQDEVDEARENFKKAVKEVDRLQEKLDAIKDQKWSNANREEGVFTKSLPQRIAEALEEAQRLSAILDDARAKLDAATQGDVTGEGDGKSAVSTATAAGDALRKSSEDLKKLRIQSIEDIEQRERKLIDLKYDEEAKKAKAKFTDKAELAQALGDIEEQRDEEHYQLTRKLDKELKDRRRKIAEEIEDIRLKLANKGHALRMAQIDAEEKRELEAAARDKTGVDPAQIRSKYDAMRQQAQADAAEGDKTRAESNEELALRTKYQGYALEKKLLDLQEQRALKAAQEAGENLDLVRQEYELKRKLAAIDYASKFESAAAGTFQGAAADRLGSSAPANRTAIATEESARYLRKINAYLDAGGTFA